MKDRIIEAMCNDIYDDISDDDAHKYFWSKAYDTKPKYEVNWVFNSRDRNMYNYYSRKMIDKYKKPGPSAKPVKMLRIHSHMITIDTDSNGHYYICDMCHFPVDVNVIYCAHCGQKLIEVEEEE